MLSLVNANSIAMPLAAESVNLIVTSPPYFGLRSYGKLPGEIGSEPTPADFIEAMRAVGRECWRVLHPTGVLALNLGDSYATTFGTTSYTGLNDKMESNPKGYNAIPAGLRQGDRMNIPHQVAAALQADGWTWRSTIIWRKQSAMPESVSGWTWTRHRVKVGREAVDWKKTPKGWDVGEGAHDAMPEGNYQHRDNGSATVAVFEDCPGCPVCAPNDGLVLRRGSWRPTTAHEYIFVMVKSMGYYGDGVAVKEPAKTGWNGSSFTDGRDAAVFAGLGQGERVETSGANPRDVLTFKATPFSGAHYATFPTTLPEWFIRAFTPEAGVCAECGEPWARVIGRKKTDRDIEAERRVSAAKTGRTDGHISGPGNKIDKVTSEGFRRTCAHDAPARPALVLDPFCGSGSTGIAARQLGRRFVGLDLSEKYLTEIARERLGLNAVAAWAEGEARAAETDLAGLPLFAEL